MSSLALFVHLKMHLPRTLSHACVAVRHLLGLSYSECRSSSEWTSQETGKLSMGCIVSEDVVCVVKSSQMEEKTATGWSSEEGLRGRREKHRLDLGKA